MKSAVLLALLLFAVGLGVSYSVKKTADWRPIIGGATACAGGVSLMIYTRGKRRDAVRIEHGCRAEYGPLELRIQAIAGSNRYAVYVEDPRLPQRTVYEQVVQSTLESAKEYVALRAHEYLKSYAEGDRSQPDWRCS